MKRSLFIMTFVAVVTLVAYACNHENESSAVAPQTNPTTQIAFDNLNNDLDALDAQFPASPTTRRGGRFWRIFGADFFGGLFGWLLHPVVGVISGISASRAAAIDFNKYSSQEAMIFPKEEYICLTDDSNLSFNGADSMGLVHNKIICEIYDEQGDAFFTLSKDAMDNIILEKVEKYYGTITDEVKAQLPAANEQTAKALEIVKENDLDASFDKALTLLPECKNELLVTKKYCEKIEVLDAPEVKMEYTKKFDETIDKSNIPVASKKFIKSTTSVAGNSNVMWQTR